jgi:radical SAM family uncharacterized protein/radical SAM-linked protein
MKENYGSPEDSLHTLSIPGCNIDEILPFVKKPSRYIGHEFNAVNKDWQSVAVRAALVFPDLYEIGMSHQGLQILYRIINAQDEMLAERVYAPDKDFEDLLRKQCKPIFSLESRTPLSDFDFIGITLPYELCYTNILTILDLGNIPFLSSHREESHPLVIGGGSGSFNPEPVAEFFDAILLGDGEAAILEIAATVQSAKEMQLSRLETLERLASITGVYVPAFFEPQYDSSGQLLAIKPLRQGYEKVQRRILADLEASQTPLSPLVPLVRIVHDRLGVEVARGCTRGCRFCQAGIIYRPVRERTADSVVELAEKGIAAGGFEEMALLSLSTGDYSCLSPALGRLMDIFAKQFVSVSMPSMRVGTLTQEIMKQIKRVRKTGFTLAPEAGTDRLRKVINKGITEEDLLKTCQETFEQGWKLIKFYFMFGLPTETLDDVKAIGDLVRKAAKTAQGRSHRINVSVATFVPKPHTPFQWEPQLSIEQGFERIDLLKKCLPRSCKLKWHDPRQSFLEGVMSRGDRRLARVIEEAWHQGARLDAWTEHYELALWQNSAEKCNIDLTHYLRRRDMPEILPWQHLDTGVDEEFLKAEFAKALEGEYTPDCRVHACQKCGVCDFKELKPIVQCKPQKTPVQEEIEDSCEEKKSAAIGKNEQAVNLEPGSVEQRYRYRFSYSRIGDSRFLSHLEVIQIFFQAFRRAALKIHFSQGFNPVPKVTFSQALPVGTESMAEYMDVDLKKPVTDENDLIGKLNLQLPAGFHITSIVKALAAKKTVQEKKLTSYRVKLNHHFADDYIRRVKEFHDKDIYTVHLVRKGKKREIDLRKQVSEITVAEDGSIDLIQLTEQDKVSSKPMEIIKAVLNLTDDETLGARILKLWTKQAE